MATVIFLCGLASAGKTTYAKKLALETGAIRFTLDERMMDKYDYSIFDAEYGPLAAEEKELIWQEAQQVLQNGDDVVLDWSLWSRQARIEWPAKVQAVGYDYKLIYLEVPLKILKERLVKRNSDADAFGHHIPIEEIERFSKIFEPPTAEENLNLELISVA